MFNGISVYLFLKHNFQGEGIFHWTNDSIKYTGQFQYNQVTGKGKYEWYDGSWYEGEVMQGLRHGFGTYWTNSAPGGETIYSGDWKDGLRCGKGVLKFKSGYI